MISILEVIHMLKFQHVLCWRIFQGEGYFEPSWDSDVRMALSIMAVLAGASIVLLIAVYYLSATRLFQRVALTTILAKQRGYTISTYPASLIGVQGITQTPLRPSGKVQIKESHYEAKTWGTYISPKTEVVVIGIEGTSLVVRHVLNSDTWRDNSSIKA